MRTEKFWLASVIAALLAVVALVGWQILNLGRTEEAPQVSVIVDNSSLDRWTNFKEGLKQGSKDYNIRVNIVSTSDITSMNNEKDIIEKEISNGAQALVIELFNSYNQSSYLEEINNDTPIVLVATDSSPEDVFYSVTPDNSEIGKMLAEELLKDLDGRSAKVGILAGNQEQLSMFQRLSGFRKAIEGSDIEIAWQISGHNDSGAIAQMTEYQRENHAQYIIAFDNPETETAIDYYNVFNGYFEGVIYGVGCSEKAAYYIDNGLIAKLVVPDEFDMGYKCALSAAKRLSYISESAKQTEISCRVIEAENLYEPENQTLIFPETQ